MQLIAIGGILVFSLLVVQAQHLLRMFKRMKWFFIAMLIIFAFNTPGEHIQAWSHSLSPTYEGLALGLLQVLRMLVLLTALSLIMALNTQQQLVSGFYFMLLPLQYIGVKVERFAARLWLTLDYVESNKSMHKSHGLLSQLMMFNLTTDEPQSTLSIHFKAPVFSKQDITVLCGLGLSCLAILVKAFT